MMRRTAPAAAVAAVPTVTATHRAETRITSRRAHTCGAGLGTILPTPTNQMHTPQGRCCAHAILTG